MFDAGQKFSNFTIIRKLGEGGMGEVYLAEDLKLHRQVALKVLHAEFFDSGERLERFKREATTAAQISHPNVMSIYDINTATDPKSGNEIVYIVMEYIAGQSLTDFLRDATGNLRVLMRIAEKSAAGLAAAHKLGIVHRDIKPDNIRISEDKTPKILDFGLAKPTTPPMSSEQQPGTQTMSADLTQEGRILGTVTYMSPEQARGGPVDARSDMFSFGILLYKMFSGEFPFEGQDRVSTLAKILEAKHEPVRRKNEAVPAELERIIDKCLQKDPGDRYQDSRDLVVDLRSLRRQYESGISDSDPATAEQAATPTGSVLSRVPRYVGAMAAFALIAAVAIVVVGKIGGGSKPVIGHENALAILGFENKTGDDELDWLTAGLPEILLTDLAQGGGVNLISRSRVLDYIDKDNLSDGMTPSHQACVDAAYGLGASKVLSGSFFKLGDKLRIDARLEDASSGQIILGEKVVGDDPFVLVDSLTTKIAQSLDLVDKSMRDTEVADITSSSPEAYKHYIMGMQKFNLDFEGAVEQFEKAIEIDSTFALPYMRIAMSYVFEGRNQQAVLYFAEANKYANKLPVRERSLLDIYSDIWLRNEFDDAFAKIRNYLGSYPDDKETRGYYALMLNVLKRDPNAAIAQLDTVMMFDPDYFPALTWYSEIYLQKDDIDRAIEYAVRAKEANPKSPSPLEYLLSLYYRSGRMDEAVKTGNEILEKFPEDLPSKNILASAYILKGDLEAAEKVAETIRQKHADDVYAMISYYSRMANIRIWEGRFLDGIEYLHEAVSRSIDLGDSSQIYSRYNSIGNLYQRLELKDSAEVYVRKASEWATGFQGLDLAVDLIRIDRNNEPEARKVWTRASQDFKSKIPEELWVLVDNLELVFEGLCNADTAMQLRGYDQLISELPNQVDMATFQRYGMLLVETGDYQKALDVLSQAKSDEHLSPGATQNLLTTYYLGRAYEGLDNTEESVRQYELFLKYWGDADIQIPVIKDCKRRLKSLAS